MVTNRVLRSAAMAGLLGGFGCGDGTGPDLKFVSLPGTFRTEACVRGNITRNQSVSASIASTDCDGGTQYFETYQLKVSADGPADISVTSTVFDTYVAYFTIDSVVGDTVYGTPVAEDDDSGGGVNGTDALIAGTTLRASEDYLVLVGGFDYTETGAYKLSIK